MTKLSVILLCGGKGVRVGTDTPKQYLPLGDKPLALHSFETLFPFGEMIVVAMETWRGLFMREGVKFADPGVRRQDSVANGFIQASHDLILIHDVARPFVTKEDVELLIKAKKKADAVALAAPMKSTVKRVDEELNVLETVPRETLWEVFTPQLVDRTFLEKGFKIAAKKNLTVTDDLSLVELAKGKVKLVQGRDDNFKVTTKEDYIRACERCRSTS